MFALASAMAPAGGLSSADEARAGVLELAAARDAREALESALRFFLAVSAETLHNTPTSNDDSDAEAQAEDGDGDGDGGTAEVPRASLFSLVQFWRRRRALLVRARARLVRAVLFCHTHSEALLAAWHTAAEVRNFSRPLAGSVGGTAHASVFEGLFGLARDAGVEGPGAAGLAAPPLLVRAQTVRKMGRVQRWGSVFQLAVWPFLLSRLRATFSRNVARFATPTWGDAFASLFTGQLWEENEAAGETRRSDGPPRIARRVLPLFVRMWPLLEIGMEALGAAFMLAFMYGRSAYFSPGLWALGVRVRRQTMDEARAAEGLQRSILPGAAGRGRHWLVRLITVAFASVGSAIDQTKYVLPLIVFSVRFLEWWHNEANMPDVLRRASLKTGVPPPPEPPRIPTVVSGGADGEGIGADQSTVTLPPEPTVCGLCKKPRTNDAATPAGFLFCYPCLFAHTETHRSCPITRMPMEVDHIRKIYEG